MLFKVLFMRNGYEPVFVNKADPLKAPLRVTLSARRPLPADPRCVLRGRVVDGERKPVLGAVVSPRMSYYAELDENNIAGTSAIPDGADPMAISDKDGKFILRYTRPLKSMDLFVCARGLAPRVVPGVATGKAVQTIQLASGGNVVGRLLHDKQPVESIGVGAVQVDRLGSVFVGSFESATDGQGRFTLYNLTPGFEYFVYTTMRSSHKRGSLRLRKVKVTGDDQCIDLGEMNLDPTFHVRGKLVLSDGGAIPAHTQIMLCRECAWDQLVVTLGEDGSFDFEDVPDETYTVSVRVPGYHLSSKNTGRDAGMPDLLAGRISTNIDDLLILFDPGPTPPPDFRLRDPSAFGKRPLRGVSAAGKIP